MDYTLLNREALPYDGNTYEFEGLRYKDTQVSFIWVDMPPGGSVRLHRHPYAEVFIIQEGTVTLTVNAVELVAHAGQVVVVPADMPHKFVNTGDRQLRQVDIHVSRQFITDWLEN